MVANVVSQWKDGNLIFMDLEGNKLMTLNAETKVATVEGQTQQHVSFAKTTDGEVVLDPAAVRDRVCVCIARVTEVFANGTGAQPTFKIGDETDDDAVLKSAQLTNAALNAIVIGHGPIAAGKDAVLTATEAAGNGTGAIDLTVLIF